MTKREKENNNKMVWKLARNYARKEKTESADYLDGMWRALTTVGLMLEVDFTDMLIAIAEGKTYNEYFGEE